MEIAKYIFTDLALNNNKFWQAELDDLTVKCTWGRVGEPGASNVRSFPDTIRAERFFRSKCNEKERKGYTLERTLGAAPVARAKVGNLAEIAHKQIQHDGSSEVKKLIDDLVQRNIHAIEGATSIRYNSTTGQFTTPRGVVTLDGLEDADVILDTIGQRVEANKFDSRDFENLVNSYMRIVPRDIGRKKVTAQDLFPNMIAVRQQKDLLDTLRTVVKDAEQKAVTDAPQVFRTKITLIDQNDPEHKRIDAKFEKTKNSHHHQTVNLKLKKVYKITVEGCDEAFENDGAKLGAVMELWHGTKDANLLSILKSGYVIPGRSSSMQITGRMFGDGIYFSDQSTKSLNYATGFWGGGRSQRCFMLLNDVAMGKGFEPTGSFSGGCKPGYDSTFAKPRISGVMNNEMIVYRTSQIRPKYLCEFE